MYVIKKMKNERVLGVNLESENAGRKTAYLGVIGCNRELMKNAAYKQNRKNRKYFYNAQVNRRAAFFPAIHR
jgi:hypothetical protein